MTTCPFSEQKKKHSNGYVAAKKPLMFEKEYLFMEKLQFTCLEEMFLRLKIIKTETGVLREVLRLDNFRLVIPSAVTLEDAFSYLLGLYDGYDGVFTAYHIVTIEA